MELTDKMKQQLKKLGVIGLMLFGSRAQGVANAASDYDFFVIGKSAKETYDALYDLLSSRINELVDIDIVFSSDAPLELKQHVATYGLVLFETSPNVFADFRQQTMMEYADFAPLRAQFQQATLERASI